jgi:CO dehydrogenase nickel-insertion accessory protein CooC1
MTEKNEKKVKNDLNKLQLITNAANYGNRGSLRYFSRINELNAEIKFNEGQVIKNRMTSREAGKRNRKIEKEKKRLFRDFDINTLKARKYLRDIFSDKKVNQDVSW